MHSVFHRMTCMLWHIVLINKKPKLACSKRFSQIVFLRRNSLYMWIIFPKDSSFCWYPIIQYDSFAIVKILLTELFPCFYMWWWTRMLPNSTLLLTFRFKAMEPGFELWPKDQCFSHWLTYNTACLYPVLVYIIESMC